MNSSTLAKSLEKPVPWRVVTRCGLKRAGFGSHIFLTRGWALSPNQLLGIYVILSLGAP